MIKKPESWSQANWDALDCLENHSEKRKFCAFYIEKICDKLRSFQKELNELRQKEQKLLKAKYALENAFNFPYTYKQPIIDENMYLEKDNG